MGKRKRIDENQEKFTKEFSNKLNSLIKEKGISQAELARETDITPANINHYKNGMVVPNLYTSYKLAKALNVSLDEMLENII